MDNFKIMNETPIHYNGYNLVFIATKYQFGGGLAIEAEEDEGTYAIVSENLLD